jgi:hypothetical protein
VILVG